jgi:hypothetical protein
MVHPQVAHRGNNLQLWRVAVNILNKQPRTADDWWFFSLGVGHGGNKFSPEKNNIVMKILKE